VTDARAAKVPLLQQAASDWSLIPRSVTSSPALAVSISSPCSFKCNPLLPRSPHRGPEPRFRPTSE
jgi:hypothetical protein